MKSGFHRRFSGLVGVAAAVLLAASAAQAGELKTLETATLAPGGSITARSTPKDPISPTGAPGSAISMEAFEFHTSPSGGSYFCEITSNATNKTLNLSLIGVNATVVNSCSAASGSTCSTPAVTLAGNLEFICLVATSFGSTTATTGSYIVGVHH